MQRVTIASPSPPTVYFFPLPTSTYLLGTPFCANTLVTSPSKLPWTITSSLGLTPFLVVPVSGWTAVLEADSFLSSSASCSEDKSQPSCCEMRVTVRLPTGLRWT